MLDRNYFFEYDVIPCVSFDHKILILNNKLIIKDWFMNCEYRNIKKCENEEEL